MGTVLELDRFRTLENAVDASTEGTVVINGTVNVGADILEYADEAAAVAGGILVTGDVYRTALGALGIKL